MGHIGCPSKLPPPATGKQRIGPKRFTFALNGKIPTPNGTTPHPPGDLASPVGAQPCPERGRRNAAPHVRTIHPTRLPALIRAPIDPPIDPIKIKAPMSSSSSNPSSLDCRPRVPTARPTLPSQDRSHRPLPPTPNLLAQNRLLAPTLAPAASKSATLFPRAQTRTSPATAQRPPPFHSSLRPEYFL